MTEAENPSEAARILAAQRKRVTGACAECGRTIAGTSRRKYCSNRCAAKAHRKQGGAGRITQEWLERLDRVRAEIMQGRYFDDDSTEIIRQSREERSRQIDEAVGGK